MDHIMKKGFITIATGDERYYRMARNLLRSYRQNCSKHIAFAIIADRHNKYTEEFDEVVILENPTNTWMDKLSLLRSCPFDENIFIDADCLVYRDIDYLWDLFSNADDFSCFGKALPMDSTEGWFTSEAAEVYPIKFLTHLHGMLYFLRKSDTLTQMDELCQNIIQNYSSVKYKGFNDRLADEPVFALAMAILDLKPIERKAEYYCFVPFATTIKTNYYLRTVKFSNPTDGNVNFCDIVHWGNQNTLKAPYRFDAHSVNLTYTSSPSSLLTSVFYRVRLLLFWYKLQDCVRCGYKWSRWVAERILHKIKRLIHK